MEWECHDLVLKFFVDVLDGEVAYPLSTEHLTQMVEWFTDDYDSSRDLSFIGPDVEGVTEFSLQKKPRVSISDRLWAPHLENRRRMTIAHELGHVHFHAVLFKTDYSFELFRQLQAPAPIYCKRQTISRGGDWMEWQAGFAGGAFLMPKNRLLSVANAFATGHSMKSPIRPGSMDEGAIVTHVANEFQVSEEAARVRLLQHNVIEVESARGFDFDDTA
jgi:hypothetical protein